MAKSEERPREETDRDRVGEDIAKQLHDLRADLAALVASLQQYGALGAEELRGRAQDLTDDAMAESLKTVKELRRQVDSIQSRLEGDVRAHPLAWMAGALGFGMLFGLLLSRRN